MHRYHAHSGVQRADGLFGGLVVHKPADNASLDSDISVYKQQPERLLLVGDWYHRPANAVFDWFQDPNHFGYEVQKTKGNLSPRFYMLTSPIACTRLSSHQRERLFQLLDGSQGVATGLQSS